MKEKCAAGKRELMVGERAQGRRVLLGEREKGKAAGEKIKPSLSLLLLLLCSAFIFVRAAPLSLSPSLERISEFLVDEFSEPAGSE